MKKALFSGLLFTLLASSVFAIQPSAVPYGIGAKYAALGGSGTAIVGDISCAYFNPAGIIASKNLELKIGAGSATDTYNKLVSLGGDLNNPAKLLSTNFANSLDINGDVNAIVGFSFAKIGISVLSVGNIVLTKTANTIDGTVRGSLSYDGVLTLGQNYSIPNFPLANLSVGVNIKAVNDVRSSTSLAGATSGTDEVDTYTGAAFDVGAKADINTLAFPLSIGVVMKDINANLKGNRKTTTTAYNPATGAILSQTSTNAAIADLTNPTTLSIGAATTLPITNILLTADIDSVSGGTANTQYSVTHLGLEYPLAMGLVKLRIGSISGGTDGSISQTTLGAGFNVGLGLNVAWITDNKNSKNNSMVFDFGFAL